MKKHTKKMIAPIVIVLILALYYIGLAVAVVCIEDISLLTKILLFGLPTLFVVLSVVVLVQRIKEIRSGEEDDLSKY